MNKTIKLTVETKNFGDESWRVMAKDAACNYPVMPQTTGDEQDDRIAYEEWASECLNLAGLDWCASYNAPGYYFAHEPVVYIEDGVIHFEQARGYDV